MKNGIDYAVVTPDDPLVLGMVDALEEKGIPCFGPKANAAIEDITSPDGRVFGKMGHSKRTGAGLYKNVPGEYNIRMFEAAVKFFK